MTGMTRDDWGYVGMTGMTTDDRDDYERLWMTRDH